MTLFSKRVVKEYCNLIDHWSLYFPQFVPGRMLLKLNDLNENLQQERNAKCRQKQKKPNLRYFILVCIYKWIQIYNINKYLTE